MKTSTERPLDYASALQRQQSRTGAPVANKRMQMRIPLQIPIKVTLEQTHETISTTCQDISWGGVTFTVLEPLPEETHSMLIAFPWTRGESLTINATVLRTTRSQNGQYLVAARFSCLLPANEVRLGKLLRMLITKDTATDRSEQTHLFQELNLIVSDVDEFRDMLAQIVTGSYTLLSFNAYELNQSVGLLIEGPDDLPPFSLRARVAEVQQARSGKAEWTGLYKLTLALEHPIAALRQLVDALPRHFSVASEAPPAVRPTTAAAIGHSAVSNAPSAIELNFPEIRYQLIADWGDVRAFTALVRELTLGDIGQSSVLPPDVWDELYLLQSVHDRAYGLSEAPNGSWPAEPA